MKIPDMLLSPFYEDANAPCDQPILFKFGDIKEDFIAVFSSKEKLVDEMLRVGRTNYKIKIVTDCIDFIESVREHGIRIMLDPHDVNGKTRWTELIADNPDERERVKLDPHRRLLPL